MGQSINALVQPNEAPGQSSGTWASTFGAMGDIGGTMVGGPVGGFIGSIIGSLFGSMFGSHESAAQMPDVTEGPSFRSPNARAYHGCQAPCTR
jgi:hypothetical protein